MFKSTLWSPTFTLNCIVARLIERDHARRDNKCDGAPTRNQPCYHTLMSKNPLGPITGQIVVNIAVNYLNRIAH